MRLFDIFFKCSYAEHSIFLSAKEAPMDFKSFFERFKKAVLDAYPDATVSCSPTAAQAFFRSIDIWRRKVHIIIGYSSSEGFAVSYWDGTALPAFKEGGNVPIRVYREEEIRDAIEYVLEKLK